MGLLMNKSFASCMLPFVSKKEVLSFHCGTLVLKRKHVFTVKIAAEFVGTETSHYCNS